MSKAYENGNKHDQAAPIPFTKACYDEITDIDYPIPIAWAGDSMMYDLERKGQAPSQGNRIPPLREIVYPLSGKSDTKKPSELG